MIIYTYLRLFIVILIVDINECENPRACGINAECINVPGNYSCACINGFFGNPFDGCADINECDLPNTCGPEALCTNMEGSYRCECPQGYDGDPYSQEGCQDANECARSPCARNALCMNMVGSFRCSCPEGFEGDGMDSCIGKINHTFTNYIVSLLIINPIIPVINIKHKKIIDYKIENAIKEISCQKSFHKHHII